MNKMDLVLQGPFDAYSYEIANHYLNLPFANRIIASCWQTDNISKFINDRIVFVQSDDVSLPGLANRNRQIKSSLEGLKKISTAFSAKMRSDQKISLQSMQIMHDFYEKHQERELHFYNNINKPLNRVCVSGIFRNFPFHPRDHLFWGNTQDLLDVFNIPLDANSSTNQDYSLYTRTEAYIASFYYAKFDQEIENYINHPHLYLVDNAPFIAEAFAKSAILEAKVFKPFPKIDFEWPKHGLKQYHYDYTEKVLGEYWSTE
jgi:WavE lipopolysaccharide synthesis